MSGPVRYLTPGTHVWFVRGGQEHAGTVESRQAGVYRVSTPSTESYLVRREDVRERRVHANTNTQTHPET